MGHPALESPRPQGLHPTVLEVPGMPFSILQMPSGTSTSTRHQTPDTATSSETGRLLQSQRGRTISPIPAHTPSAQATFAEPRVQELSPVPIVSHPTCSGTSETGKDTDGNATYSVTM